MKLGKTILGLGSEEHFVLLKLKAYREEFKHVGRT
jgi:hypothetical protein